VLDRDGAAGARYELLACPLRYFIDRQGVIRNVIIGGPMSESGHALPMSQDLLQEP